MAARSASPTSTGGVATSGGGRSWSWSRPGTCRGSGCSAACLAALTRDFAAYRAAWFLGTYLALEPTDEEKAAHQPQHRTMLRSTVPATVTAAVRLLADVGVDRLDREADPDRAGPAVEARTKSTALAALKLAVALAPEGGTSAVAVVRLGLGHPHVDVQRFAARQLTAWDAQATVVADADLLAPSLREELGLAPTAGPAPRHRQRATHPRRDGSAPADVREHVAALLEDSADAGHPRVAPSPPWPPSTTRPCWRP